MVDLLFYFILFLEVLLVSISPAQSFSEDNLGMAFWAISVKSSMRHFGWKSRNQNDGQAIFWRSGEKKIDVYAFGCCSILFIKQANLDEVTFTPFILLSTSKEDSQKSGPSDPNYILPVSHRHHQILGREIRLVIWDDSINLFLFWSETIPSSLVILWFGIFQLRVLAENLLIFYKKNCHA